MHDEEKTLHKIVALICGRESACGIKHAFFDQESAEKACEQLRKKVKNKTLHVYPCAWCSGWHVGREMTRKELIGCVEIYVETLKDGRSQRDTP